MNLNFQKKKILSESHSVSKLEFTESREVTKSLIKYCFQNFLEKAKENIFLQRNKQWRIQVEREEVITSESET